MRAICRGSPDEIVRRYAKFHKATDARVQSIIADNGWPQRTAVGDDIKVMQELLRHASARVTLDTYTQAIIDKKRKAQTKVVRLLVPAERRGNRSFGRRLCPSVPTPNRGNLGKTQILFGVPDGI